MSVFLEHLNSLHPSIEFTMEMEEGGSLPFLDTLIKRNKDGTVDTSVYRKPTHTDHYLQYSSHHPSHVKLGMVSGLFHRARGRAIERTKRRKRNISFRYCRIMDFRMKWSGLHCTKDNEGHRMSNHTIFSTSPMYQDLVRISEGSAGDAALRLSLGPPPL